MQIELLQISGALRAPVLYRCGYARNAADHAPFHIRSELLTRHCARRNALNLGTPFGGYLALARFPFMHGGRLYAEQQRKPTHATSYLDGLFDRKNMFHSAIIRRRLVPVNRNCLQQAVLRALGNAYR